MAKQPAFILVAALIGIALPGTMAAAADLAIPKSPKAAADSERRICVVEPPITGSILPLRVCKTHSEWKAAGIDIDKLIASRGSSPAAR